MIDFSRYVVIKRKDIEDTMDRVGKEESTVLVGLVKFLLREVGFTRYLAGKKLNKYIVIAEDWPEYETVKKMLEDRIGKE